MAEKFSTGLRNHMLGGRGFRECFADSVLKVYSGTAPTEADDATSGTLLVTITKSSGTASSKEHGVVAVNTITVPGVHVTGTYAVTVTVDGTTYTATFDAAAAHANNDEIAQGLCWELNKIPQVMAICPTTGGATGVIGVACRIPGITLTIADGGGTITFGAAAAILAGSRAAADTLQFKLQATGIISKIVADTWSGVIAVSGTAGYFRLVTTEDLGTDNVTDLRLQGNVSTSGAEMNLSSVGLVAGATITLSSFDVTFPAS